MNILLQAVILSSQMVNFSGIYISTMVEMIRPTIYVDCEDALRINRKELWAVVVINTKKKSIKVKSLSWVYKDFNYYCENTRSYLFIPIEYVCNNCKNEKDLMTFAKRFGLENIQWEFVR